MDGTRSAVGRFAGLSDDHPAVGDPCVVCREPMTAGQVPTLISLCPADAQEAEKQRRGGAYNAVAGIAHQSCAWPETEER